MSDWVDVVRADEFTPGTWRCLEVDGVPVAVFNVEGAYHAIENVCTHDGGTLTGGTLNGEEISCPRHGARFSVKTGKVLAPPAYSDVATLPVRVENGMVQVRDPRWD